MRLRPSPVLILPGIDGCLQGTIHVDSPVALQRTGPLLGKPTLEAGNLTRPAFDGCQIPGPPSPLWGATNRYNDKRSTGTRSGDGKRGAALNTRRVFARIQAELDPRARGAIQQAKEGWSCQTNPMNIVAMQSKGYQSGERNGPKPIIFGVINYLGQNSGGFLRNSYRSLLELLQIWSNTVLLPLWVRSNLIRGVSQFAVAALYERRKVLINKIRRS